MHHYHSHSPRPPPNYGRQKSLLAKQRERKYDKRGPQALSGSKKLNKQYLKQLTTLYERFKPKTEAERRAMVGFAFILATATLAGVAYHMSKQNGQNGQEDVYKPRITNQNYSPKISPGESQNINFTAVDVGANNSTIQGNIAKAVVEITPPGGQAVNQTVIRHEGDLFSLKFDETREEGNYKFRTIVEDADGNSAVKHGSFDVKDELPIIKSSGVNPTETKVGGNFTLHLQGEDDVGIEDVYAEVIFPNRTSKEIPLILNGTQYATKFPADQDGEYRFRFSLRDTNDQIVTTEPITVTVAEQTLRDRYEAWIPKEFDKKLSLSLFDLSDLTKQFFESGELDGLESVLRVATTNSSALPKNLAYQILDKIERSAAVEEKVRTASDTFRLLDDLKIYGLKRRESLNIPANATLAMYQGLPKINLYPLFNASEINPEIVDFSPATMTGTLIRDGDYEILVPEKSYVNITELVEFLKKYDMVGEDVSVIDDYTVDIKSENVPRDLWIIGQSLVNNPELLKKTKWFLPLNMMAQQKAYDFFDNPEMREYGLSPTDRAFWEVVEQETDWMFDDTRLGFPIDLHWVSDINDKKIAHMVLFESPMRVADLDLYKGFFEHIDMGETSAERRILAEEYIETTKENYPHLKHYGGIHPYFYHEKLDAMKYVAQQLSRVYNEVVSEFPNGTETNPYTGDEIPYVNSFYGEFTDREFFGVKSGVRQFLGSNIMVDESAPDLDQQYIEQNPDSINTHLSKNFPENLLIKYIDGYGMEYGGTDKKMDWLYYPIAFKAFRIPVKGDTVDGTVGKPDTGIGFTGDTFFGLPDDVLKPLTEGEYGEVIIFPGNGISKLGSTLEGIKEDLAHGKGNPETYHLKHIKSYLSLREKIVHFFKGVYKN